MSDKILMAAGVGVLLAPSAPDVHKKQLKVPCVRNDRIISELGPPVFSTHAQPTSCDPFPEVMWGEGEGWEGGLDDFSMRRGLTLQG